MFLSIPSVQSPAKEITISFTIGSTIIFSSGFIDSILSKELLSSKTFSKTIFFPSFCCSFPSYFINNTVSKAQIAIFLYILIFFI